MDELAPEVLHLSDSRTAAVDYSCDPPSVPPVQMSEGAMLGQRKESCICGGLVDLQAQQAPDTPEVGSSRRSASKAPKGKKKRGKK